MIPIFSVLLRVLCSLEQQLYHHVMFPGYLELFELVWKSKDDLLLPECAEAEQMVRKRCAAIGVPSAAVTSTRMFQLRVRNCDP